MGNNLNDINSPQILTCGLSFLFFPSANNTGSNKRQITDLVDQSIQITTHCFVVTADNRYILVCGFWDKSFRVYSSETGRLECKLYFLPRCALMCGGQSAMMVMIQYCCCCLVTMFAEKWGIYNNSIPFLLIMCKCDQNDLFNITIYRNAYHCSLIGTN